MCPALSLSCNTRHVSTQYIHAPRERFIGLIDRIASQNHGIAADTRLRVDHRIAPDDRSAAPHLTTDVEASKQNKDVPSQVSLHLHRAEQAGRVMHLLPCGDEDVLPEIGAIARRLAKCANREQKRQNETT